jgi:hypothetical protein
MIGTVRTSSSKKYQYGKNKCSKNDQYSENELSMKYQHSKNKFSKNDQYNKRKFSKKYVRTSSVRNISSVRSSVRNTSTIRTSSV